MILIVTWLRRGCHGKRPRLPGRNGHTRRAKAQSEATGRSDDDLKALAHRRGGSVVGVPRLRRLNGASARRDQRHRRARDRAHRRSSRSKAHRKPRGRRRAQRERRAAKRLTRECCEGDRLTTLRHLKALVDRRGSSIAGVACLRRLDRACTRGDHRHRRARYRAHARSSRSEAYSQPRRRARAQRKWRRAQRLVGECREGDSLTLLHHLEALINRRGGTVSGVACLRRLDGASPRSN